MGWGELLSAFQFLYDTETPYRCHVYDTIGHKQPTFSPSPCEVIAGIILPLCYLPSAWPTTIPVPWDDVLSGVCLRPTGWPRISANNTCRIARSLFRATTTSTNHYRGLQLQRAADPCILVILQQALLDVCGAAQQRRPSYCLLGVAV